MTCLFGGLSGDVLELDDECIQCGRIPLQSRGDAIQLGCNTNEGNGLNQVLDLAGLVTEIVRETALDLTNTVTEAALIEAGNDFGHGRERQDWTSRCGHLGALELL